MKKIKSVLIIAVILLVLSVLAIITCGVLTLLGIIAFDITPYIYLGLLAYGCGVAIYFILKKNDTND